MIIAVAVVSFNAKAHCLRSSVMWRSRDTHGDGDVDVSAQSKKPQAN